MSDKEKEKTDKENINEIEKDDQNVDSIPRPTLQSPNESSEASPPAPPPSPANDSSDAPEPANDSSYAL